jgi:uncharacterized protein (DUF2384 family)
MKKYEHPDKAPAILAEPATAYGQANYFALAGRKISKNYIRHILAISKLTLTELIDIIPVSIDTYKRKTTFQPPVTEKILEIEEVYHEGLHAFGEGFHAWMNTENIALGGIKPKQLLSNSFGVRRLLNQIGRMQHGVLA